MIVVDTSVWIDVVNERQTPQSQRCLELIANGSRIALTDVVLTELLQGLRSDEEAQLVEQSLRRYPILRLEGLSDFALSAELYRSARRAGVTIRNTLDCLIAAPCIRSGATLLHADRDFDRLAACSSLRIHT